MLQVNEAQEKMVAEVSLTGSEKILLTEAVSRTLAVKHVTQRILPPWDNSAMDGFAIRSEDTASASETNPVTLQIVAEVACGARQSDLSAIGKGEAVRIMTGAPLPCRY